MTVGILALLVGGKAGSKAGPRANVPTSVRLTSGSAITVSISSRALTAAEGAALGTFGAIAFFSQSDSDEYEVPKTRKPENDPSNKKYKKQRGGTPAEQNIDKIAREHGLDEAARGKWGDFVEETKRDRGLPPNHQIKWRELERLMDEFKEKEGLNGE